jgi:oligoendopeptidase F
MFFKKISHQGDRMFAINWDLENIFLQTPLHSFIDSVQESIDFLEQQISQDLFAALLALQKIQKSLGELQTYAHCLIAQDTSSDKGPLLENQVQSFLARTSKIQTNISFKLQELSEDAFAEFQKLAAHQGLGFIVSEMRRFAQFKLSMPLESLITDLSIDGYHGFSQMFSTLHGNLKFDVEGKKLSFGQLENLLHDPREDVRKKAFIAYNDVFSLNQPLFAHLINHIAGFRLEVYKARGWSSTLFELLQCSRMEENTLKAMWACVKKYQPIFHQYLQKKARLLSKDKLAWYDLEIPLFASKNLTSFETGSCLILSQIKKYGKGMEDFCRHALKSCWVEAEDRPGKAAGGFCAALPILKQSRIFMTYLGTDSNISTLAHELGHAYHNHHIFHHPYLAQLLPLNLAETASTMFELMVSHGLLQDAKTVEQKLALLDDKIMRSITFFMNIEARYLFEMQFYEERKQGFVSHHRLSTLMETAQKSAYGACLESYNPLFWASKMHFYFTDVPFYNFPYTFGYLMSLGLFAFFSKQPHNFEKNYNAFLQDTTIMSTEDLLKKHLGVSLDTPEFWELAMQQAVKDVHLFLELI